MTERMGLAAVGRQNGQRAALARRAELRPAARRLAAVAVGFAGGWAVVYGALMPFGLGFVLGFAEDCFAPCAAGAALGVLLHGFGALSLRSVCMLCALGAAVAARWMGARTLTPAALAGCGTLVGVALCFAFGGGGAELVLYSAADALLAAAMGFCLRQFAPEKPGAGMLLVGAATAAALGSVQLWQLLPGVIVCAALELYLCSKGQAKAALAACAVLGAALCAADPALSFAASGLACATVAAAVLAPGRRMETVAAYAGGCVTGALCVQPPGSAFQYLLNVCIGITAVAAMPAAWLVPEPEEKPQAGQAQPQQYSAAATRLEQVSQSLASLAETVNDVYETLPHRCEDFHWVIDNTHDTLCFNCGRRDTCWKQEYAATLEGMEALRPLLEENGVHVLSNTYVMLERGGDKIALLGAEDSNGYADQKTIAELSEEVRQEQGDVYKILLSHRNTRIEEYVDAHIDLTLCGHAHGGLIRLPGTDGLIGPHREFFPSYTAGLYDLPYGQLVASRGLGNQFPAFRLFNRPDVPVVVLE